MDAAPTIEVVSYDPVWPEHFRSIHDFVWQAVEGVAIRIDHVGSTSVPGLVAKPIIDMDVVVVTDDLIGPGISRLASIGYNWIGDLGVAGREAFSQPSDGPGVEHHLYLVVENNRAHVDHLLLRDLLRSDADARSRYGELKVKNAILSAGDLQVYTARKASLVAELLTAARRARGLTPVTYWEPSPAELLPPASGADPGLAS